MGSNQCNVELSICSGTKENHRKPWSSWPASGPSGCKLTSSQQSGIKSAKPTISPYLCCCFFFQFFFPPSCFLQLFVCAYDLDKLKPYITHMEGINAYVNKYAIFFSYFTLAVPGHALLWPFAVTASLWMLDWMILLRSSTSLFFPARIARSPSQS
jgi:hypothetical protein